MLVRLALAQLRDVAPLPGFRTGLAGERRTIVKLDRQLRGEDDSFDFGAPSLQNRLLGYFESKLGLRDTNELLRDADNSRKAVLQAVARGALLGLHPKNKELHPLVENFSDYELWLLNQVVLADDSAEALKSPLLTGLISRKLKEGRGKDVIQYLSARFVHHEARMRCGGQDKTIEFFNPRLVVIARMWTFPGFPLWLIPGGAAAKFVSDFVRKDLELVAYGNLKAAYNRLLQEHNLKRISPTMVKRFISAKITDSEGRGLQRELELVIGMPLSKFRGGASAVK